MSVKKFAGKIVSNKMMGTVVVAIELPKRHPIYGKMIKNTKRIKAHTDEAYMLGAEVEIVETSPFSKEVSFKVVKENK
jgi:small subunit ribosomal protein S17